jgi:hypothetical protein
VRIHNALVSGAILFLSVQAAQASIVRWDLSGTLNSPFTLSATLDTSTPNIDQNPAGAAYFDVFQSFDLRIGNTLYSLDPNSSNPDPTHRNYLTMMREQQRLLLQFRASLLDGAQPIISEWLFEFSDPFAYPVGDLESPAPSLASATLKEFANYSPHPGGGLIFRGSGRVDSFVASPSTVPEPGTLSLIGASLVCWLLRRRRQSA